MGAILYNLLVTIVTLIIVFIYIKKIWNRPTVNGDIYSYWVTAWFILLVIQLIYFSIELEILPIFPYTYVTNGLLSIVLSCYIIISLVLRLERGLSVNNINAWRKLRFFTIATFILTFFIIVGGLTTAVVPFTYRESYYFFGSTTIKNSDIHFFTSSAIQSFIIFFILIPWREHKSLIKERMFLSLGGLSHGIGKIIQLTRSVLESDCEIMSTTIRILFFISTILVLLGIGIKKDINYLSSSNENNEEIRNLIEESLLIKELIEREKEEN